MSQFGNKRCSLIRNERFSNLYPVKENAVMSWLYSFILAGLIFSGENNLPVFTNSAVTGSNVQATIKSDETERFEQVYPLNANGKVSVSNVNGSITIETWDNPQVKLEYVKTGNSKESLAQVDVNIEARQEAFSVETNYDSYDARKRKNYGSGDRTQVEYRLTVPRTAVLDEIETVNGSITISNAVNTTKASAVNGQVKANNLRGTTDLSTVNGTVDANFDQLEKGSKISLDTVNGTVNLTVPSDADATVKADTVNGKIDNDFGLPVRKGKYVGKDLYGRIGSGDVKIKLSSVNGGLSIKHKNDGKTVNPVTNLLTTKDDDDWDGADNDENSSGIKLPKPPKPPKPPKFPVSPNFDSLNLDAETQKQVEQAMRDAQQELDKMTPEMQKQLEAELKKKVNINVKEMQEQIRLAQEKYREAAAQMSNAFWSPEIEKKGESFPVKGIPQVTVEAGGSAVSVRGWDKPEVQYFVTRISRNTGQAPMDFKAVQNGQEINIKTINSGGAARFDENRIGRVEVFVPRKSNLKIITTGEIRLEGVSGEINLNGTDGAINVRDADGKMQIVSNDGTVRVIGFRGELDAQSVDGAMSLEGNFQKFSAKSVDGNIILTLPDGADVNIESNRKDIEADGVALVYLSGEKNHSTWKVGNGGVNHRLFSTSDGQIIVRGANVLKTN